MSRDAIFNTTNKKQIRLSSGKLLLTLCVVHSIMKAIDLKVAVNPSVGAPKNHP